MVRSLQAQQGPEGPWDRPDEGFAAPLTNSKANPADVVKHRQPKVFVEFFVAPGPSPGPGESHGAGHVGFDRSEIKPDPAVGNPGAHLVKHRTFAIRYQEPQAAIMVTDEVGSARGGGGNVERWEFAARN